MNDKPVEYFEALYKQGAVNTASVPRVILMLYDRIILFLGQALEQIHDLSEKQALSRRFLKQALPILNHLLSVFLQSEEPAYLGLHNSHALLLGQLSAEIQKNPLDYECLFGIHKQLNNYRRAWREQLQIRSRKQPKAEELQIQNPSESIVPHQKRLNVRRKSKEV